MMNSTGEADGSGAPADNTANEAHLESHGLEMVIISVSHKSGNGHQDKMAVRKAPMQSGKR